MPNAAFDFAYLLLNRGLDPLIFGDYPSEMRHYLGSELPQFSLEETKCITDSIDFIGVNHYSSLYAKDCTHSPCLLGGDHAVKGFVYTTGERDGVPIGDRVRTYDSGLVCYSCLKINHF